MLCLVALVASGCGKRETPARQTSPAESVASTGVAVAASVPQSQGDTAPAAAPVTEAVAIAAAPEAVVTPTPSAAVVPAEPASPLTSKEAARKVSALVRAADEAVRASPAGSQAWVRVEQARAAYSETLRQDAEYRDQAVKLARIDAGAITNAAGDVETVGAALAEREQTLVRDVPAAARARADVDRAERDYGALVQADARYVESVRLIKTMEDNGAQSTAP